ncbi:LysR family transcriptional regulator [Geosporobacter ferrireducens]|uniref:HTH lysR-type domain-containing protein n=1 Tax=Geosporobacter ferrireducens TaxID=1424294 RepID=A0A1D8GKT8_9FIRM|nr:LysR family transcriptional regulator [Geosporobacter ferrireducens]AOT71506.1 hypothetical protein Gferi_19405 [Geosporobacter ferrireducens]MTI57819.1 LysR family transcriptional regulator [Geosporobacter ferrireducens]
MNLAQIRCFVTCAQTLNFTRTAEILYTTQPNISKKIVLLEDELGIKLFERNNQYVSLTPHGKILYDDFVDILNKIDCLMQKASNINSDIEAHLNIGLHGLINLNRLAPRIFTDFIEKYPNINLIINSYSYKELRTGLMNGNLDLIITYSLELYDSNIASRYVLSRSNPKLYYSSTLDFTDKKGLQLIDFRDTTFLLLDENESPQGKKYIFSVCQQHGFLPHKIKYVNNIASMIVCVEQGIGVAMLGSSYKIQDNNLINCFEVASESGMVGTDIIWLKDNNNLAVKVFENYILKTFI